MVTGSVSYKVSLKEQAGDHYPAKINYNMIHIIRFFLLTLSLLTAFTGIMAQNPVTFHPGSKGIFISCGDQLPISFNYRISRRDAGQKEWQILKSLSFPKNKENWEGRIFSETMNNRDISMPDSATTDMLWRILKRSSLTDSLYSWKMYPFMLSACGTGWWGLFS